MNINQHRKMVQSLTTEAEKIRAELLRELQAEGLGQAEADAIVWTGQVRVIGQTVWHKFRTPGSWAGITFYRFAAVGEGLKSREPEDMEDEAHTRDYPITD